MGSTASTTNHVDVTEKFKYLISTLEDEHSKNEHKVNSLNNILLISQDSNTRYVHNKILSCAILKEFFF